LELKIAKAKGDMQGDRSLGWELDVDDSPAACDPPRTIG
jgi:hypothetical protein